MNLQQTYQIPTLPLSVDLETKEILKKTIQANKALAELSGIMKLIPNPSILINSLTLQEARDSSAIENIITTQDELYQADMDIGMVTDAVKEVQDYRTALLEGFEQIKSDKTILINHIINTQELIEHSTEGIRKIPGTALKNEQTGEIVYVPPQDHNSIIGHLKNLEDYLNIDTIDDLDPLIKLAVIHHQFESIHPFSDGNGRTGRILNVLYLIQQDLIDLPVLYLSGYIIKTKGEYYRLLQRVRDQGLWAEWVMYVLDGIEKTSYATIDIIKNIRSMMGETKLLLRDKTKFYSKDLLEILYKHPYTKIDFLVKELLITRKTASKYLRQLEDLGVLESITIGTNKYFINTKLYNLFKLGLQFEVK